MASLVIHQRSSANEMRPPAAGAATTGPRPCARGGHALDRPRAGELAACDKFWADARARLGRLYRLSDRDLDEIEACLAKASGRGRSRLCRSARFKPPNRPDHVSHSV